MDEAMATFFRDVAEGFLASGRLRLAFLSAQGMDVASVFQFRTGGALLLYNSGYDPSHRAANPGLSSSRAPSVRPSMRVRGVRLSARDGTVQVRPRRGGPGIYRLTVSA